VNARRWPTWQELPQEIRALGRWVTVVQLVGYSTALVYVWQTTRMVPGGIADHYRGNEASEGAMQFPKSLAEMLTISHTHLLAMTAVFLVSGLGLSLCSRVSPRWKHRLMVEPFVALLVSFSAMWLMRYLHPGFGLLLQLSSTVMALTFYWQCGLVLREVGLFSDPATAGSFTGEAP